MLAFDHSAYYAIANTPYGPDVVTTYIFTDHLNTPRVITRASDNKIVWRWDQSDPFGVKPPNENPNALGTFTYNPRFPGQLYDAESGLVYNYFRHYDPKTGGFTQSDPIGLAGGINTYAYVGGNPVNWIDPLGLKKKYPYSHPHCTAIKNKIDNINKDLDERWDEYCSDPGNLPERIGPGEARCETRRGHRSLIDEVTRNRDYWQGRYDNECGDDDDDPGSLPSCPNISPKYVVPLLIPFLFAY